jgi:hypothetical protein
VSHLCFYNQCCYESLVHALFSSLLAVFSSGETVHGSTGFTKLSKEELRERVVAAAKLANAHTFISEFPQGYDTDVGSSGSAMSGGRYRCVQTSAELFLDDWR